MDFNWIQGLLATFGVFAVVQLVYILAIFSRLAFYKHKEPSNVMQPVSVIIVAKNEIENLRNHLHLFFEQTHPEFEVVLVDNASWDGTDEYLEQIQPQYPNLKVVTIKEQERYPKGKKFAITLGIKASKYETLLLTDADCIPAGENWITHMQQAYTPKTEVVLGYGAYKKRKGLLNYCIRYETFYTALQYLSFALAGKPYMGVGRNLSYKKSTFFAVKGFARHNHVMSGDDALFVNEVGNKTNTQICIRRGAFTVSEPKTTWKQWFKQKKRHMHTGKHLKGGHKFNLALLNISHILFYGLGITLVSLWYMPEITGIIYGVRLIALFIIYNGAMQRLREKNLIWGLLLLDAFYAIYYLFMGLKTLVTKQKEW